MKRLAFLFLIFNILFLIAGISYADITAGLVAYYPFNGNANDESINENHGTVNGATLTTDRFGNADSAYSFDGMDDYVDINDSTSLRPSYATFTMWLSPKEIKEMKIIGKSDYATAQNEQYVLHLTTDGTIRISIKRDSNCLPGQGWYGVNSNDVLPTDQWSFVAGSWDGSVLKIYINGILQNSNTNVPTGAIDNCQGGILRIGKWWQYYQEHFNGFIDDIRIYNRALSSSEILQLYGDEPSVGVIQLPKTGQTKCYNSAGTEISCTGTGQDGEIQAGVAWPDPRFTVGTGAEADCVTDNLTGLMWAKDVNLPNGTRIWQGALDYVASINNGAGLCGYTDWQIPNINEVESLVNEGEPNIGTWLIGQGFLNVQSDLNTYFWSSTTYDFNTSNAWVVSLYNGVVGKLNKDYNNYVWPVRSGQSSGVISLPQTGQTSCYNSVGGVIPCPSTGQDGEIQAGVSWPNPRFTIGIGAEADCVTDNLAGLMWVDNANLPNGRRTWQGALDFVASINSGSGLCGYTDWHLPNRKELRSLIDHSASSPALPSNNPFTDIQSSVYWTSTTFAIDVYYYDTRYAWYVYMLYGYSSFQPKENFYYVWPVRSGKVGTNPSPTLLSPANGSNVNSKDLSFEWSPVANADSYEILVDNNSGFGSPEINRTILAPTTTETLTNPFPDNAYFWKVRAKFSDGSFTNWASPWQVTYNLPVHAAPVWVPLYRLYHSTDKDHYYTTIPKHRDDHINADYNFEKVEAYISDRKFDDPNCGYLLHLWDEVNNIHFYTSSETEKDNKIIAGYSYEGIVGFIYTAPTQGTAPFHHLEKAADTDNFYTISQFEYDNAIDSYGFTDMGIVGYVSPFAVPNNRPQGNFSGVDTATGAFHPPAFTDLSVKGVGPDMSFIRYYNSYNFLEVPLGSGWSHSLYNYILEVPNGSVVDMVVKWGDGSESYFQNDGADNFTGILGNFNSLVKFSDDMNDGYNLTTKSQTLYEFRRITVNTAPSSEFIPELVLTAIEDKHGKRMQFAYTAAIGLLYRITDAAGRIFDLEYNASNQLIKVTDNSLIRFIEFTYDTNGNLETFKDARGNITNYGYNSDQLLDTITFPETNTISITYDNNEPLRRVTGYTNGTIQLSFDYTNGTTISNSTGPIMTFSHDNEVRADVIEFLSDNTTINPNYLTDNKLNLVDEVVDRTSNRTTYTYDSHGNVLTVTKAPDTLNQTTTYTYDINNNMRTIQEPAPRSNVTTFTYSPDMKNLMSVARQEGGITQFAYYASGLVKTVTDPNTHVMSYTYDSYGNPLQITDNALGTHIDFTNDNAGRLLTKTDELLKTTAYTYDPNDNMRQVENADNKLTIMNYDINNRLAGITDPRNKITSYTYNNMNLLESETNPVLKTYQYGYDNNGNVNTITDHDGNVTEYVYDQISNRLTYIKYNAATKVTFTQYDLNGNLEQISYDSVTTNFTYDDLNRISNYTDRYGNTVQYEYDVSGNRTKIIYPGAKVINYVYDGDNRLSTVTDWLGGVTTYNYDNAGLITSVSNPNGTTVSYSYDPANRLTGLTNKKSDATVIADYSFTLNDVGNPTQVVKNEPLIPVINAVNVNYAYDNANRITTAGSVTYTNDNRGNLTGSSSGNIYDFDYADRLTQVTIGGQTIQYAYDGFGNRTSRTSSGTETRYIHDLNGSMSNILAETDSGNNITNYYIYGHGLVSKITAGGQRYVYHYDNIGNTIAITNNSGNVTESYAYDEFGKTLSANETIHNPFRYVGKYGVMDEGNGLLFMRARFYDVNNGRFIKKDPIGFAGGDLNLYAYVGGNPLVGIDPSGLSSDPNPYGEGAFSALKSGLPDGGAFSYTEGYVIIGSAQYDDYKNRLQQIDNLAGFVVDGGSFDAAIDELINGGGMSFVDIFRKVLGTDLRESTLKALLSDCIRVKLETSSNTECKFIFE